MELLDYSKDTLEGHSIWSQVVSIGLDPLEELGGHISSRGSESIQTIAYASKEGRIEPLMRCNNIVNPLALVVKVNPRFIGNRIRVK